MRPDFPASDDLGVGREGVVLHGGLGHSGVLAATMWPFAGNYGSAGESDNAPDTIAQDDRAGANVLYPDATFATATGGIAGLVTLGGGSARVYGAQVVATRVSDGIDRVATIVRYWLN